MSSTGATIVDMTSAGARAGPKEMSKVMVSSCRKRWSVLFLVYLHYCWTFYRNLVYFSLRLCWSQVVKSCEQRRDATCFPVGRAMCLRGNSYIHDMCVSCLLTTKFIWSFSTTPMFAYCIVIVPNRITLENTILSSWLSHFRYSLWASWIHQSFKAFELLGRQIINLKILVKGQQLCKVYKSLFKIGQSMKKHQHLTIHTDQWSD